MVEQWNQASANPRVNRSPDQLARFFDGLELLEPGLVSVAQWRPAPSEAGTAAQDGPDGEDGLRGVAEVEPQEVDSFGGVALKH